MLILPASRQVLPHWNSRHWTRQQLQCFALLSDHPSKSSTFPDDQLSDHPSESSSSAFSATSASDFNRRTLLSAVEQLRPALDELKAWQQAWQPVIDRLQAQQRDSDLVIRDILSELRRLQSSRATQDLHALLSQTVV
jgi:hypothetical protein